MSHRYRPGDIPEIAPGFRFQWEEAQGCHVILYPEGMIRLNAAAGEILKRCDGQTTVADLLADLMNSFPDTDLEDDVYTFLDTAHEHKWLRKSTS